MPKEKAELSRCPGDLEFTYHARKTVEKTIQDPYFRESDPEMILKALLEEIRSVSFGDYLRRYIRRKEPGKPFHEPEGEKVLVDYICDGFNKRNVPVSFEPTSGKLRAMVKNWLKQRTVGRDVVLLLGFALEMSPDEVNEILAKALREPRLDPKNPMEVICWYCYKMRLSYAQFEELWEHFSSDDPDQEVSSLWLDSTVRVRTNMESISTEPQLAMYLERLGQMQGLDRQSVSARKQFELLYQNACQLVADRKTEMAIDDAERAAEQYADELSSNDRLFNYQKRELIRKKREDYHTYTAGEITPSDLENMLYAAVPKDRNGNLSPMKESLLDFQFSGKRLNRQRIQEIRKGKVAINRFDLITLSFFVATGDTDRYEQPAQRYNAFILSTNIVLKNSDMDPLYVANPFECFLMMCMLTDDPLGSFADVWELSYEKEERTDSDGEL